MDPKLFVPLVDNTKLPKKVRDFFRFGVPLENQKFGTDMQNTANGGSKKAHIALNAAEESVGENMSNPSISLI